MSTNRKHMAEDIWYIYTTDTMQCIKKKECGAIRVNIKRSKCEEKAHLFSCHLTDLSNHLRLLVPL